MVVQVDYTEPEIRYDLIAGSGDDPYDGLDRFDRVVDCLWENYGDSVDAARIQYGYDRVSNRTWRENPADPNRRYDQLYAYDGLYRLTDFRQGELNTNHDGINDENFRQAWNLDATGNWSNFNQDDDGNSTWDLEQSRDANKVNEITDITNSVGSAWIEPQYDPAGNMTTMPKPDSPTAAFLATYDAWNRLVRIAVPGDPDPTIIAEYQYDGRTFRTLAKEYDAGSLDHVRHFFYSDAWQVLEERLDSSTDADRQYVWGIRYIDDLILRDRDTSDPPNGALNERLYALQDDNWNVIAICDDEGDVKERFEYEAYGKPVFLTSGFGMLSASAFDWEVLYSAYRFDASVAAFLARNRFFSPLIGCWMSRDPVTAGSRSLYAYSRVSPINLVDPFGLRECNCPPVACQSLRPVNDWLNRHINSGIRTAFSDHVKNTFGWPPEAHLRLIYATDWPGTNEIAFTDVGIQTRIEWSIEKTPYATKYARAMGYAKCILVECGNTKYCIGTDKIGHFFQQGYMLYELASQLGEEYALMFSGWTEGLTPRKPSAEVRRWLEHGSFMFTGFGKVNIADYKGRWGGPQLFGLVQLQTSTADHAANKGGLAFYEMIANADPEKGGLPNFDICDYVTSAWREFREPWPPQPTPSYDPPYPPWH